MSIPEPKVEHHEGLGIRSSRFFSELRPILDEAFEILGDKSEYVVAAPQYRAAANTAWLEECKPTQRDDAAAAPRWSLGLATIVLFDAGQQTDRAPPRVLVTCGLLVAWQLTTHRPAELLAGHRGCFCKSARGEEGDGRVTGDVGRVPGNEQDYPI